MTVEHRKGQVFLLYANEDANDGHHPGHGASVQCLFAGGGTESRSPSHRVGSWILWKNRPMLVISFIIDLLPHVPATLRTLYEVTRVGFSNRVSTAGRNCLFPSVRTRSREISDMSILCVSIKKALSVPILTLGRPGRAKRNATTLAPLLLAPPWFATRRMPTILPPRPASVWLSQRIPTLPLRVSYLGNDH